MATAVTLDSVNSELKESNKKLKTIKDLTVDSLDYQLLSIETFEKGFFELTEFLKGNSLLQIEKDRELAEYNKDLIEAIQDIQASPAQAQQDSSNMLLFLGNLKSLGIFAGIASVALGSAAGIISGYINNLKLIGKAIVGIVKMLTPNSLLTSIGNSIKSISTMFTSGIKLMSTAFMSGTSSVSKFFTSVGTFFSKALDFKPIKDAFAFITRVFNGISEFVKTAMGMGEKVAKVNESVSKFSSTFSKVFGGVLKVVSKIFTPIITIFTTIMGAIEGFKAEGIIGLIKGAITGFFEGFIGGFLDIVKDLTSWVLGALGFEKAEKFLDSFSFNDLFKEFVNSIFGFVDDIFTGIIESFKAVGNSITTAVSDVNSFIKSILKNSLPIADKNKPWYSVNNLAAKAIPDAVYKFVGINSDGTDIPAPPVQEPAVQQPNKNISGKPATYKINGKEVSEEEYMKSPSQVNRAAKRQRREKQNELVVQEPESKRAEQLGSQMNLAKQEGDQLKAQADAASRSGNSTNNVSSNTVNNVNNSNTTVVKPAPSPGKRPSNVSDLIWSY
jgi:phage-related protein